MIVQPRVALSLRDTGRTGYNKHKKDYDERRYLSSYC